MVYKAAVASLDGKVITLHFGRCERYYIVKLDTDKDGYEYAEYRDVTPPCKDFEHSRHDFDAVAEALADCAYILVAKIGPGAQSYMSRKGFTVLESPELVDTALEKLLTYIKKRHKVNGTKNNN
jgi:predicted Fe-Mo cluster-binding NifX family protein|nr:dinitrogenase iron-molybdenum cofactor biosynthesis protein [Clostridiales bacterium]